MTAPRTKFNSIEHEDLTKLGFTFEFPGYYQRETPAGWAVSVGLHDIEPDRYVVDVWRNRDDALDGSNPDYTWHPHSQDLNAFLRTLETQVVV